MSGYPAGVVGLYSALSGRTPARFYPILTDAKRRAARIFGGELHVMIMALYSLQTPTGETIRQ